MKTVGIIGGLDFLGCDIALKFLYENFKVNILVLPNVKHTSPLIKTGLIAGENLMINQFGLENHDRLIKYIGECDFLVHCGSPYKLPLKSAEEPIYVPIITGTGNILRAMKIVSSVDKIIFITSADTVNNSDAYMQKAGPRSGNGHNKINRKEFSQAILHSEHITYNLLEEFNSTKAGLMVVSPVVIRNNILMNTANATLHGIRYLLRNDIKHDFTFRRLSRRIMFETMLNIADLPDKVYNFFKSSEEKKIVSRLVKN
jgi:dihydroflavonol-4-reductase